MDILKRMVFFGFFALTATGCSAFPLYSGAIPYQYRNDPGVKKAYEDEKAAIRVEVKSIVECFARNKARIDSGFPPEYYCYPHGGYGGYYGGFYGGYGGYY